MVWLVTDPARPCPPQAGPSTQRQVILEPLVAPRRTRMGFSPPTGGRGAALVHSSESEADSTLPRLAFTAHGRYRASLDRSSCSRSCRRTVFRVHHDACLFLVGLSNPGESFPWNFAKVSLNVSHHATSSSVTGRDSNLGK